MCRDNQIEALTVCLGNQGDGKVGIGVDIEKILNVWMLRMRVVLVLRMRRR